MQPGSSDGGALQDELQRLRARVRELEREGRSADLGRDRFEDSPIPMTEEDWSAAKAIVDRLVAEGVTDFVQYVRDHPEILAQLAPAVKILDANPAAVRIYGATGKEELLAALNEPPDLATYNPTTGLSDIFVELIDRFSKGEARIALEGPDTTLAGSTIYIRTTTSIARGYEAYWGRVLQTVEDFTTRKAAEEHLRQAQRMDAIGQLTGGVAHDFNNLLAVIQGNAELLATSGEKWLVDPSIQAILRASQRGAELTQRLLAYACQQPLQPRSVDVATLTREMAVHLLKRTLGEGIAIEIVAAPDLWPARADPGQLENALLNLAINAQHAMPGGGRLTFACANVTIAAGDAAREAGLAAGDYLRLAVSDSGAGMTREVADQAFEPFFTTKEVGEGSGLGLSMVYGFAKQSGGEATIETAPGAGTTVTLHLPRAAPAREPAAIQKEAGNLRGRGETILVVEDEPEVRRITVTMLCDLGYKVLEAGEAESARALLEQGAEIDLLLSDVVLPGRQSGPAFARLARQSRPGLKVVFMSGYPAETADRHALVDEGEVLLGKPFQKQRLAAALRAQLADDRKI